MEYMNCMSCNKVESPMRRYHSRVPFLPQHRFLAETRCEVTSTVSMMENHTLGDATGPQPGERFTGQVREEVGGWLGSWRFLSLLLLFQEAFVVGYVALEVAADEIVHV